REVLLALPEKRLIAKALATPEGDACTLGVVLLADARDRDEYDDALTTLSQIEEDEDSVDFAPKYMPRLVAWEIVAENDLTFEHATPEDRYIKMLKWVDERLAGKKLPTY